jgi:ubiquinone/menaquinone biosynthesis C-methylase UbiE
VKLSAREYLYENLKKDHERMIGPIDEAVLNKTVDAWMNDHSNSAHRFHAINKYFPNSYRILDMAAGCGTCVFYGLQNGFEVHGVEPEEWKLQFNAVKATEKSYPPGWSNHIKFAYGESLPYEDDYFDVVTSYQTLEHVSDVSKCLEEMMRVVKTGGGYT